MKDANQMYEYKVTYETKDDDGDYRIKSVMEIATRGDEAWFQVTKKDKNYVKCIDTECLRKVG